MKPWFRDLDEEQLSAVTAPLGPLLVVAGAGTGKTRTMVHRLAWLVDRGVPPDRLLLLTFTNKAAASMKARAERLVQGSVPWAGTFHHVAHRLLRVHGERLGYSRDFTIMSRDDARLLLDRVMKGEVGPLPPRFPSAKALARWISLAQALDLPLGTWLLEHHPEVARHLDLVEEVATAFSRAKARLDVMDFDDLLLALRILLEDLPEVSRAIRGRFFAVLVDEYQDTNATQVAIADLLAQDHGNIMAVGDDAQAIYGFRGASSRHMADFPTRHPGTTTVRLVRNYRSTQAILDVANLATEAMGRGVPHRLVAQRPGRGILPRRVPLETVDHQAEFVLSELDRLRAEGIAPEEVAVLYRAHYQVMELELLLTKRGIPFSVRGGRRFFERPHVRDLIAHLRVLVNHRDELAWHRIFSSLPHVGRQGAAHLMAGVAEATDLETWLREPIGRERLGRRGRAALDALTSALRDAAALREPGEQASYIVTESILPGLDQDQRDVVTDLDRVAELAARHPDLASFLDATATHEEPAGGSGGVTLSTVHQAKGLEWRAVFVIYLAEGHFPLASAVDDDGMDEERRLFYVAVTRAMDRLYLCFPASTGPRAWDIQQESRFTRTLTSVTQVWTGPEGGTMEDFTLA